MQPCTTSVPEVLTPMLMAGEHPQRCRQGSKSSTPRTRLATKKSCIDTVPTRLTWRIYITPTPFMPLNLQCTTYSHPHFYILNKPNAFNIHRGKLDHPKQLILKKWFCVEKTLGK